MRPAITSALAAIVLNASADVYVTGASSPSAGAVNVTELLKSAISTVYYDGGSVVISGRCYSTDTINNPGVRIAGSVPNTMLGDFNNSTVLIFTGPGDGFVCYNYGARVGTIENLTIIHYHLSLGNKNQRQAGIVLRSDSLNGLILNNVMVQNANTGLLIGKRTANLRVTNCRFESLRYNGVVFESPATSVDHQFHGLLEIHGIQRPDYGRTNTPPLFMKVGWDGLPSASTINNVIIDRAETGMRIGAVVDTSVANLRIDSYGKTAIEVQDGYPGNLHTRFTTINWFMAKTPMLSWVWPEPVTQRGIVFTGTTTPNSLSIGTATFPNGGTGLASENIVENPLLKVQINRYSPDGSLP